MPELPEVETVARQLNQSVPGSRVRAVEVIDPKYVPLGLEALAGLRFDGAERIGKRVLLSLHRGKQSLLLAVHLRMTGRLIWAATAAAAPPYARVRIFTDKGTLWFCDLRRFGVLELLAERPGAEAGGLEPLGPGFTVEALAGLLQGARGEIKPWLLRQDKIAGLGNIYASEILFAARVSPQKPAGKLDALDIDALQRHTTRILKLAVRNCGTTFSDFQDSRGEVGGYKRFLKVYQREGQPCPDCGSLIARLVQQQRSTFYCPHCQPL